MLEISGFAPDTSASAKRALVPPMSPTSAVVFADVMRCPSGMKLRSRKLRIAAQRDVARKPPHIRLVGPGRDLPAMRGHVETREQSRIGDHGYAFGLSRIEEQFLPADEMSNGLGATAPQSGRDQ